MQDNACVAQAACGAGTFYKGHTNKPRECLVCPANTYQDSGAHRDSACKPHTACGRSGASIKFGPGTCAPCPAPAARQPRSWHACEQVLLHARTSMGSRIICVVGVVSCARACV